MKPSHALRLFKATNRIVASRRASLAQVRHIIGLWTYALILRMPAFSILFHTFRFLEEATVPAETKQWIPNSVLAELGALLDVFPFLTADIRQKPSTRVYFSDACKTGSGVQYADLSPLDAWLFKDNVAETRGRKGWYSNLVSSLSPDEKDFAHTSASPSLLSRPLKGSKRFERAIKRLVSKTAVAHKCHRTCHISNLKTGAQLLAVRHMASCPFTHGHRVISPVGNTSTLGAIAKGRSSASTLNQTCRIILSVLLKSNITLLPHWVSSALSLADKPSRSFKNDAQKRFVALITHNIYLNPCLYISVNMSRLLGAFPAPNFLHLGPWLSNGYPQQLDISVAS